MDQPESSLPDLHVSRRAAVSGLAVVAAGASLAACSRYTNTGRPKSGSSSASSGQAVAKTTDIPVGGGKILGAIVVTQPTAGQFKAFSSTCTHQGCTVATVTNGQIICPCHSSTFSATDGSVISGPAPAPLPAEKITVSGDSILQG